MSEAQEYTGVLTEFIYRKERFSIFRFRSANGSFTALGEVYNINKGDKIFIRGTWETHPVYKKQFRVKAWEKIVPTSRENVIEALSCGLIKGVGPVMAERIVDKLGVNALEIILENPEPLKEVKGLSPKKAAEVAQMVAQTYDALRVVAKLVGWEITQKTAFRIYKKFGRSALEYIQANPYCLTNVEQIGFIKADEIARKIGIDKNSPYRIKAGILFVLNEALWDNGHTYLPLGELIRKCMELLNKDDACVSEQDITESVNEMDSVIVQEHRVSLKWVVHYEKSLAQNIKRLNRKISDINPAPVIQCYEAKEKIKLTDDQKQAVVMALNHGLSVLTGGPGVGKTATIKAIITVYKTINPGHIIKLAAPTGRAARRITEVSGKEATTLHKLLEVNREGRPSFNKHNPLSCDLLVADEMSMADLILAKNLFEAIKTGTRVLLVGDIDQLPSVGPGNILRDILSCNNIPRVTLNKVFRQAAKSQIIANAHRINKGQQLMIDTSKTDFFFFEREEPGDIIKCILHCISKLEYDVADIQVLSPLKKGPLGTQELNKTIQEAINPKGQAIKYSDRIFRVGDKVIQTKNDYEMGVFNGDIGVVKKIEGSSMFVQFNGDLVKYGYGQLNNLELAYCITIHKSQGSEFKAVIIPLTSSHYIMLARNLLYTAITRAREKVILVGTRKALAIAIRNNTPVMRYTKLKNLL
ncbi:ATP-dependent RecD-like DNA helicase [Desulfallas sp. Bu1-1]|uniref:SF1B family DNA helicase RecD2 n=1 Tax=Desulfallas sp. Bu1-1 TaxID=2787620 RepID=UPI00189D7C67|nr:ATP-dependent RecD-like DNA helicase [Desulfallas sp. Bu1-1]MBF7083382.1 ATP-dependent RecD-like DNA helicase [Desulfallas sp. Bu1-1]